MKKLLLLIICISIFSTAHSQNEYFFPNKTFNTAVPTPSEFLGYEIGSHHTRYDKLVEYMNMLATKTDRVKVEKIGETNEHRAHIIVHFANPANLKNIETIRKTHLDLTQGKLSNAEIEKQPSIVWLGYNVHGNEASGGEASILTAYYLAACTSPEITKLLDNTVILMEPVLNPDGRDRFVNWVNMHKGTPFVADGNDREHNEIWPSGRVNHYWFDLNRDWYLAVNVESRNRLAYYHKWLPNVVTDFHEMGTNSTHFFEPTKSNAENPLVPQSTYRDLNSKFAKYFEIAMNEIGSLYYTKESFDNFYPGYGSSYPDMQGGLGLLFEQGSSRGHLQNSSNGDLSFKFAIRNQLVNALATLKASQEQRSVLLNHQVNFYKNVVSQAKKGSTKGYVIGDNIDTGRNMAFWDLILQHKIEAFHLNSDLKIEDKNYKKGQAIYIPLDQPQSLLVQSIFDRPKSFADSIFYDTSAWNLALAYGLAHSEIKTNLSIGAKIVSADLIIPNSETQKSDYAYLIDWRHYYAPKVLWQLEKNGVMVKVAMKKFQLNGQSYPQGTLMVPVAYQKQNSDELNKLISVISKNCNVPFIPVNTGFSEAGIDLGSNSFKTAEKPTPLMIIGTGTSQYEAGEVWHLLDTKIGMPITKVDMNQFGSLNLNKYTHLVMVSGNYESLGKINTEKIKDWIKTGGVLISQKTASEWVAKNEISKAKLEEINNDEGGTRLKYEDIQNTAGAKTTGGAIFDTDLDITHPIAFGYENTKLAIYKNNNTLFQKGKTGKGLVSLYTSEPWVAGYVHPDILKKIKNSVAINVETLGAGAIIMFADNPNFRGTWFSTNKLFFNALFLGSTLTETRFGNQEEE